MRKKPALCNKAHIVFGVFTYANLSLFKVFLPRKNHDYNFAIDASREPI
jgi:hypothetical protein